MVMAFDLLQAFVSNLGILNWIFYSIYCTVDRSHCTFMLSGYYDVIRFKHKNLEKKWEKESNKNNNINSINNEIVNIK